MSNQMWGGFIRSGGESADPTPYITGPALWQIAKERRGDLITVASGLRLVKHETKRTNRRERLAVRFADLLVALGTRLKARYQPMNCESPLIDMSNKPVASGKTPGDAWSRKPGFLV